MRVVLYLLLMSALMACSSNPSTQINDDYYATLPQASYSDESSDRPFSSRPVRSKQEEQAKAHVNLGMAYLEIHRYDISIDEAKKALKSDSNYPPANYLMGLAYMYLNEFPTARPYFEKALSSAPNEPDFNNAYGWFLCLNHQTQQGLALFQKAINNPYFQYATRAYTNAGLCYLMESNLGLAEQNFLLAIKADAQNAQAYYNLASISYQKQKYQQAHQEIIRFHQLGSPTPQTLLLGYRIDRKFGDNDSAESYFSQLKDRFPNSDEYKQLMKGME